MLQIGWGIGEMTPGGPALVHGQTQRRIGYSAMDPLLVTALAIEGGEPPDCAMLIACDLAEFESDLQEAVRERLRRRLPDFPAEKAVVCATHTHTSLAVIEGFYEHPGGDVMTTQECLALVADRAADAAAAAWESRAPHTVGAAFSHAVVGHNRRAAYADGSSVMYGKTDRADFTWIEGYEDHSLDLLFTWDAAGRLTGIAIDIPCPSQVDETLHCFSADFWHEIRVELRARFGDQVSVLPLCGAAGDQSPHFLLYARQEEEMRRRRGVSERREIALRVADAVTRALEVTTSTAGDLPFAHTVRRLDLTPWRITKSERDWAEREAANFVQQTGEGSWWPTNLRDVVDTFDGKRTPEPFPVEIHVLRIGDIALATNPFELYVDYGLRIKARSPAVQTFLVQLATGMGWYLPTERAAHGGSYGAMPAVCKVGPEGGQELVEGTLAMIRELFPE